MMSHARVVTPAVAATLLVGALAASAVAWLVTSTTVCATAAATPAAATRAGTEGAIRTCEQQSGLPGAAVTFLGVGLVGAALLGTSGSRRSPDVADTVAPAAPTSREDHHDDRSTLIQALIYATDRVSSAGDDAGSLATAS